MTNQIDTANQARFFTLSLDMLCIAGFDGYFKQLNPAWENTTGFSLDELMSRPFIEFVHPKDHDITRKQIENLADGLETINFENRYICKDGSIKWFHWSATPAPDEELVYAIARDITTQKQREENLHYQVEFKKLITVLSTEFINLPPDKIDKGINRALQTIGELVGVDRSYIYIFSDDKTKMDNTHEWCAAGIEPQIQNLKNLSITNYSWFKQKIRQLEILYISSVTDLPAEAKAERELFVMQQIKSRVNVPMIRHGLPMGFFGFDTILEEKRWNTEEFELFNIVAEIFVNALERKQAEQREALAYEFGRQLTTLLNPDTLLTEIVNRLQQTFGYYHAHVYLFNKAFPKAVYLQGEDESLLVMREGTGPAGLEMKKQGHAIPLNAPKSLVAHAARSFEPMIVNNVHQNPDHLPNPLLPDTRSEAAVPLFLGKRLLGVLDVQHTLINHFDLQEVRTLQIVASQLSVALSNAQLFEENANRLAIIENAANLIALMSLEEHCILYINPAGAQLAGYQKIEELMGQPITQLYRPEELNQIESEALPIAITQGVWRGESAIHRTNDALIPVDQTIFVIYNDKGQPQTLATIMTDITERKEAETVLQKINEELEARVSERTAELTKVNTELTHEVAERKRAEDESKKSRDFLNNVINALDDPVFVKNEQHRWIVLNDAFCEMVGQAKDKLIGKSDHDFFFSKEQADLYWQQDNFVFETGKTMVHEAQFMLHDELHIISTKKSLFVDPITGEKFISGIRYDITDLKQSEEMLRKQTQELARSNADLEKFAYVASHDLQEPLRMVTSYVQLLARRYRGQLDTEADEFINFAVDGATRMQQLINDLLAYSRVGTRNKEFERTDCLKVLQTVLQNLQTSIEETNATITHDSLPVVMADTLQLELLFQNLISNALKFCGQAPPKIHISAEPEPLPEDDNNAWIFSVQDNGIGIEANYLERIFIIFQRLHNREQYSGTGIGLAVCKKIVERHNGHIWVESQPGQGSTFFFTIPMIKG